jgi:hypothetical protein
MLKAKRTGADPKVGLLILYLIDKESGEKGHQLFQSAGEHVLGLALKFPGSRSGVQIPYVSQHDQ